MINAIGVKNFRSLKNINLEGLDCIDIKPFTILLGKNSSGKSSFLRLLPLLKQSVSSRTRGSLAFYGDEVDFGDFHSVLSNDIKSGEEEFIELKFKGILKSINFFRRFFMRKKPLDAIVNDYENEYEIVLKIKYDEKADYCFVASFCFKTNEETISFTVDKNSKVDSFIINGEAFTRVMKGTSVSYMSYRPGFPLFEEMNDRDLWVNPLFEFMQKICYSSEIEFKNSDFKVFLGCPCCGKERVKNYLLCTENYGKSHHIFELVQRLVRYEESFNDLYNKLVFAKFDEYYEALVIELLENFSSIRYSKPLRANADRYYRSRSLAVNELNSDGSNLVDFFVNLGSKKQEFLTTWMQKNFGFWYGIESNAGHKSIYIYERVDVKYNITDMGFGYSQILPIITQLWISMAKDNSKMDNTNYIYAIEQPELHLHPAMQCKLINALTKIHQIAQRKNMRISFVIETHSETIVNQLGRLIRRKESSEKDISVLIFSKESPTSFTEIQSSPFDENGVLTKWPVGFFGEDA